MQSFVQTKVQIYWQQMRNVQIPIIYNEEEISGLKQVKLLQIKTFKRKCRYSADST